MSKRAWVTLATNDSYGLGALVLSHSLKRSGSAYPAVVLITPTVTEAMRERLRAVFAEVVIVDVLDSKDAAHLALLQRPELGITFTKLHCWNLTQYDKGVFLDADTLVVQNCDELFEREELSAAPDVGWPDCFNSGVFVFKPSSETFNSLIKFAQERGSFDGGDQGLLNAYFSDWAHSDINKHLPFLYNVTSAAFYSYLPALKHYGQNLKIIHFIGAAKPWLQQFNWETRITEAPQHLREFLQLWWDIFVAHVHSVLDISMVEIEESLPVVNPQESFFHTERNLDYSHYEVILDPESEFPWHHPDTQIQDAEINVPKIDMTQYHDPWELYRGNIPHTGEDSSSRRPESRKSDNHEEIRNVVWDFISPQHNLPGGRSDIQSIWQDDQRQAQSETIDQSHEGFRESVWDYNPKLNSDQQYSANIYQHSHDSCQKHHTDQYLAHHPNEHHQNQCSQENTNYESSEYSQHHSTEPSSVYQTVNSTVQTSVYQSCFSSLSQEEESYPTHLQQNRIEQVYRVHPDNEKMRSCEHQKSQNNESMTEAYVNGHGEADNDVFEKIRPRHPYDGFYLKHRMTIDSRGRKVCTHEVPPTPTPTPPESPIPDFSLQQFEDEMEREKQSSDTEAAQVSSSLKDVDKIQETGVAGNFARVVLGEGAQREALDELTRRQGWEAGNIDYLGADAFENIWAKISQTLNQPRASSPKESTPQPAEVPAPALVAPAPVSPVAVDPPVSEPMAASIPKPTVEAAEPAPPKTEVPEAKAPASPTPTVATEPAKVVAAVASAEPKPAAESPVVKTPAAAKSDLPDKLPAAIPSENSEAKKDAVQTPITPIAAKPIKPVTPPTEVTSKESASTDSPPLANTPSKEEIPAVPVAKSEERRKPAGKLQLPPAAADPLPTPDSELEDAAALAHAIIAGELTPTAVTSPSPPALPASPHPPLQHERLSETEPPTPPAVSLSQIGIKPQPKATIAAQIESSVSEAAPKKKVVKKVLKKEGGGDAPVPPPRKKEKKPKDK